MKVKTCIFTDVGQSRKVNQDSSLIKVANTRSHGRITLIAVCDGMGGLSKGEVASCKAVRALEIWFCEELPLMLTMYGKELFDTAQLSLLRLISRINTDLQRYGRHKGIKLGTTMALLLQIGRDYLTINVGDSRIYAVSGKETVLLTKDQSLVQEKIDKGLLTEENARNDEERNVLLQCVGLLNAVKPDTKRGSFDRNTTVVACSDGFWRTIERDEIRQHLCPEMCVTDEDMLFECKKLSQYALERDEDDNISVAAACMEF